VNRTAPQPGPFAFYWAKSYYATPAVRHEVASFDALSAMLNPHTGALAGRALFADKHEAPLMFAAGYQDGATGKGLAWVDETRYPPYMIVDLDNVHNEDGTPATLAQACRDVSALLAPVRHDIWTSFSHGKPGKGTRIRVLISLSRSPANYGEYNLVWKALCAPGVGDLFSMGPDKDCRDVSRGQSWPCGDLATPDAPLTHLQVNVGGPALSTDAMVAYALSNGLTADRRRAPVTVTEADMAKIGGALVITRPMLLRLATQYRNRMLQLAGDSGLRDRSQAAAYWLEAVATGKAWGSKGTRNTRAIQGIWSLAFAYPDFSIESVVALCAESCRKMQAQRDADTVYDANWIRKTLVAKAPHANALLRENEARTKAGEELMAELGAKS